MSDQTTKARYGKAKEVFSGAIDLSPEKRMAFLRTACGDDEDLYREVESLLRASDEAEEFLENVSAVHVIHDSINKNDKLIGQVIDKYRIIRELGRGGMGVVLLSEREEFHQQVALKLIKRGMDSDTILKRFAREREILAALNHPYIARLLDGGTANDLPFFVMEYVEGVPFDEYCRKNNLSVSQKLELFRKICQAVAFAHQKLVVHRDLKPSNILIADDGTPKLLDFGIAKLLNSTDAHETQTNQRVLTPAYASPEQIRGEAIDTTSDVYSLGKILAEILEIESIETEKNHSKVVNTISNNELKAILQTALREETARRYGSVEKFSEDIRCYLNGLPVSAKKDTFTYRAQKFMQRNYPQVTVAALFLLTLIVGLTVVIWEDRKVQLEHAKAEQRFNDVRKLANSFMFEFHDAIETLPGSTPARKLVVDRALEYLNSLAQESSDDAALQRELATAYEKIGKIQGNSYYSNLGDTTGAMQSYRHSLEIRQKLSVSAPQSVELQDELANSFEGVGDMFYTVDDLKNGLANYQNARALRENLVQITPDNRQYKNALAELYGKIGDITGFEGYQNLGDTLGALENYEKAVKIDEQLLAAEPENIKYRTNYAQKLTNLGLLYRTVGETNKALNSCQKGDAVYQKLLAAEPNNSETKFSSLSNKVTLRYVLADEERIDEAINLSRQTIKTLEEMQSADPQNASIKRSLGVAYNALSRSFLQKGDSKQAVENARTALNMVENLFRDNPESGENKVDLVHTLEFLGEAQLAARDYKSALANYQRALSINEKNLETDSSNARSRDDISICLAGIGNVLVAGGNSDEAIKNFQQAIPIAETDFQESTVNAVLHSRLALRYFEFGKAYEAFAKAKNQAENLQQARNWYQKSFDVWNEMQQKKILDKADAKNLQAVSDSLSRLKF